MVCTFVLLPLCFEIEISERHIGSMTIASDVTEHSISSRESGQKSPVQKSSGHKPLAKPWTKPPTTNTFLSCLNFNMVFFSFAILSEQLYEIRNSALVGRVLLGKEGEGNA